MKFCIDCAHYVPPNMPVRMRARCDAQQATQYSATDLVSGYVVMPDCVIMRERRTACGEDAAWFVAKPPAARGWWPFRRARF